MRLADLPKALSDCGIFWIKIFSHLFNTLQNQNYIGPIFDTRYYPLEQMKPEEMSQSNFIFDFK